MSTKLCPKCNTVKSHSEFYTHATRADGLYGYCKSCFNTENDKRRIMLKCRAIVYKGSKCVRCELSYPETPHYIFDFHHRDPSTKNGWTGIRKHGWKKIQAEIEKCDLVCANCHRHIEYGA